MEYGNGIKVTGECRMGTGHGNWNGTVIATIGRELTILAGPPHLVKGQGSLHRLAGAVTILLNAM